MAEYTCRGCFENRAAYPGGLCVECEIESDLEFNPIRDGYQTPGASDYDYGAMTPTWMELTVRVSANIAAELAALSKLRKMPMGDMLRDILDRELTTRKEILKHADVLKIS